jgi:teichuronic acid biosynthesis glycosyltransferase TuaH
MENELVQVRDIIMLGIQPWDVEIGCNFKNMAIEMAKQYRVLYVNRPLDRISAVTSRSDIKTINRLNSIRKGKGVLEEIQKNLWVFNPRTILESINWMPPGRLYRFFNKHNNHKLSNQIQSACNTLDFKNPLLIIDNDFYNGLYLKEYLGLGCMIYYLRDYLLSQPYFYKHGVRSEPLILQKADLVITNSLYLEAYAKKYNPNTHYIGQGCEVEEFAKKPVEYPADITGIKNPVIGYCGALLSLRLDIDLLISIAMEKPHWNLVLVGPEDADFKKSKLHRLSNVHFLGPKDPSELPAYIHYFDVCLNPQLVNQMTIGNYPRKIDEYLAAGKPVVATATHAMEEFSDCTYLCKDLAGYLSSIEKALAESGDTGCAEKRIQVAKSHTWQNSIMKLYGAVNKYLNKQEAYAGRN